MTTMRTTVKFMLISIIALTVLTACSTVAKPKMHSITWETTAELDAENNEITFSINTNLKDGTHVPYEATFIDHDHGQNYNYLEGELTVEEGTASATIDISPFNYSQQDNELINLVITVDPHTQSEEWQDIYGEKGEYMKGDSVQNDSFNYIQSVYKFTTKEE